jgi:hypothetical protein
MESVSVGMLDAVAAGTCGDAFAVLGRHEVTIDGRAAVIVRTMQPAASSVELVTAGRVTPMPRVRSGGLFEARVPIEGVPVADQAYRLRVHEGHTTRDLVDIKVSIVSIIKVRVSTSFTVCESLYRQVSF